MAKPANAAPHRAGSLKTLSTLSDSLKEREEERLSCVRRKGLVGETLADWCYSVRPGQKSSTSLSRPYHLLQVEGIQWLLRQRQRQRQKKTALCTEAKSDFFFFFFCCGDNERILKAVNCSYFVTWIKIAFFV